MVTDASVLVRFLCCYGATSLASQNLVKTKEHGVDAGGQTTSLQCFNSKDMIKPDQYDTEPGTFHSRNELF